MITNQHKILDTYRGCEICMVNYHSFESKWIGIKIDGEISVLALSTVQGAKNVIDTYVRNRKPLADRG